MEIIILEQCLFRLPKMPYYNMNNSGLIVKADGIKFIVSEDFTPIELNRMKLDIDYSINKRGFVKYEKCNKEFIFKISYK